MLDYQILHEIENRPSHTQRSLAEHLGISLGKVNYILGALVRKGLIQAKRLKKNPGRVYWNYFLTPQGIEEKFVLAKRYLNRRLREFDELQSEIEKLKQEVSKISVSRKNFR